MPASQDSYEKGKAFEDFVQNYIFTKDRYKLISRTQDYNQNSIRYAEDSKKPDFTFECLKTGLKFYVEAKYRSRFFEDQLEILNYKQKQRFDKLNNFDLPVLIIVGYEGFSNNPQNISLIPIDKLEYLKLYPSQLNKFKIHRNSLPNEELLKLLPREIIKEDTKTYPNYQSVKNRDESKFGRRAGIVGVISLLLIMGSIIYFNSERSSSVSKRTQSKLKGRLTEFYSALGNGNVDLLDYYLEDHLETWYTKRNVSLDYVKRDASRYFRNHPYHVSTIKWETFEANRLPNGDFNVNYNMTYRVKNQREKVHRKYNLFISTIWNKELKIKSLNEKILSD